MPASDRIISTPGENKSAPVRLLLDGYDFPQASSTVAEAVSQGVRAVVVSLDTPKTVVLPAELAEEGVGEAYLRFNGMELSKNERVVYGEGNGVAVLMAVDSAVAALLEESFESVTYTSPLLEAAEGKRYVRLFLTRGNAYLTVREKGLKFAEVLPDSSPDSSLYYLQTLGREFKLKKFDILIGGEGADAVAAAVSQYFKRVKRF